MMISEGGISPVETTTPVVPLIDKSSKTAFIQTLDWQDLQQQVVQCTRCDLCHSRKQTVFGTGHLQPDLLFVGEAPGADEDEQGEPFVGRAGRLLNQMLRAIHLTREQIYIANVLKCRPPGNRTPSYEEMQHCGVYLRRQIALLQPKLIVALGGVAVQYLLKTNGSLHRFRNRQFSFGENAIPLIATFHPAYLLRTPTKKREAWQDLQSIYRSISPKEESSS
jgi:DNA polymerase